MPGTCSIETVDSLPRAHVFRVKAGNALADVTEFRAGLQDESLHF